MTNTERLLINDYVKAVKEGNNSEAMKIVDEFNATAVKEESTMTNEMIKEMKKLVRKYDAFTHCIEDCSQKEEAEKRNKILGVKFVEVANKMGINATVNDLYEIISNDYDSFDESIEAYIKSHEVRVVSATLTQENGELTFVELSPEQKLEISKVLDAQLQDVNYSSWFEEENGVFKLYGSWVDEDSAVKEKYYFNGNKLIKIEKEESIMKDDNTTVSINSETTVEEKEETTMSKTKIRRDSHESFESWINRINDLLSSNGIHLDNDKLLTIIDDETDCVSIESEDINVHGWCAGEPFYCCYDFHGNLKEYSDEGTNFESVEVEKEEDIMKTREFTLEELVQVLNNNQKVQDAEYIKKDDLRVILNEQFELGFNNGTTRTEMIDTVMAMYKDSLEEEAEVKLTDELATKILEKIIRQADTNRAHNFISDWMFTSIISELVIGHPLKDKGHEYYKSFTAEQRKILIDIRKAFIDKASLITKTRNGKVTGYYIPAKILVWGRHIYLGVACVYRYISKNRILAEYHVSLNGIKNVSTGNIAALDDAAYETLDTKCIFVM